MKNLFNIILLTAAFTTYAQVGINNDSPKATLDISTSATLTETDGLLVPRVPSFATTNPGVDQNSMLVYLENDLTNYTIPGGSPQNYDAGFYYWDNGATNWIAISGSPAIPTTENIYTDDGTLDADRTVEFDGSDLIFDNSDTEFTLNNGNTNLSLPRHQLLFGFGGGTLNRFRHGIATQHNSGSRNGNNLRFMLWNRGVDATNALPTLESLRLDGTETVFNDGGLDINFNVETDNHNDAFSIDGGTGQTRLGAYGGGTITGTATQLLAIDGTGNIIEAPLSGSDPNKIIDADGDTQIQVEESADEDLIRFNLAGNERFLMTQQAQLVFTNTNAIKLGLNAGQAAGTDTRSIFIGNEAGSQIQNNFYNIAIGHEAMSLATGANNNGARNSVALGYRALNNNNSIDNVGIGLFSLQNNTTGQDNVAVGSYSLDNNTTGFRNVAVGSSSLAANQTGTQNTAVGFQALQTTNENVAITGSGANNAAFGTAALRANTSGFENTAIGSQAARQLTTGEKNVAIGYLAMYSNTGSSENTIIGEGAGYWELGGQNTFIGRGAGGGYGPSQSGIGLKTTTGNVMIGYEAGRQNETEDDQLYIANSNTLTPLIGGDFLQARVGINTNTTTDLTHTLNVGGSVKIQTVMNLTPSAQPGTATEGDVYYDSTTKKIRVFTGTVWENLN